MHKHTCTEPDECTYDIRPMLQTRYAEKWTKRRGDVAKDRRAEEATKMVRRQPNKSQSFVYLNVTIRCHFLSFSLCLSFVSSSFYRFVIIAHSQCRCSVTALCCLLRSCSAIIPAVENRHSRHMFMQTYTQEMPIVFEKRENFVKTKQKNKGKGEKVKRPIFVHNTTHQFTSRYFFRRVSIWANRATERGKHEKRERKEKETYCLRTT